jgi:hypothetical protein
MSSALTLAAPVTLAASPASARGIAEGGGGPARVEQRVSTCEAAIAAAERQYGIPLGLYLAIGRTEAGRPDGRIWPWTLNVRGQGRFFPDRQSAAAELRRLIARGETPDIGCGQISWRYHARPFVDPAVLLDPEMNAAYGAWFLAELRRRHGSWTEGVKFYHSSTPAAQHPYVCTVYRRYASELNRPAEDPRCAAVGR